MKNANTYETDILDQTVATCVCNEESLPLSSSLLATLLDFLKKDNLHIRDLQDFLLKDPSLCSQILKMANSAFYGSRGGVTSVQRAIDILGIKEVLNICLAIAIKQQFAPKKLAKAFETDVFWKHSLLTAMLSRELAQGHELSVSQDAIYLMGLLHDIGRITIAVALPDLFEKIIAITYENRLSLYANEIQYGCSHTAMGFLLATKWSLPTHIALAARYHHNPCASKTYKKELAIVHLADDISKAGEEKHVLTEKPRLHTDALEVLGISHEEHMKNYELVEHFMTLTNSTWETLK